MTVITLQELLSRLRQYLDRKSDFSDVRNYVYEFYEAETSVELDNELEEVFPVLLSYLQFEEAENDLRQDVRMQRVCSLLNSASSLFAERTVFGLEYDEIRELTKKLRDQLITVETYQRKLATLSPATYDVSQLIRWAKLHDNENEPIPEKVV
jgi:hypothetical protein